MNFKFINMGELNEQIVFEDGTTCNIIEDSFIYKGVKFTLQSDVEKDLSYTFNTRYCNITEDI